MVRQGDLEVRAVVVRVVVVRVDLDRGQVAQDSDRQGLVRQAPLVPEDLLEVVDRADLAASFARIAMGRLIQAWPVET